MAPQKIEDLPKEKVALLSVKEMQALRFIYDHKIISYADLYDYNSVYIGALGRLLNNKLVDVGYLESDGSKCVCALGILEYDETPIKLPVQSTLDKNKIQSAVDNITTPYSAYHLTCGYCFSKCIPDYGRSYKTKDNRSIWVCKRCADFEPGLAKVAEKLNIDIPKFSNKKNDDSKTSKYVPAHVWETEETPSTKPTPVVYTPREGSVDTWYRCDKCDKVIENGKPYYYKGQRFCPPCAMEIKAVLLDYENDG